MKIQNKIDFIKSVQQFNIKTEYAIIKPNWINDQEGEFTEAEILGWLLEALPEQKKIVVEGYTPWRGLIYQPTSTNDELKIDLLGGKHYRNFYREMDRNFLHKTGIEDILHEFNAEYFNITECVWDGKCISKDHILKEIEGRGYFFSNPEIASYMPIRLYEIRQNATFVNFSKIKQEKHNPYINFSMTIKNMFGLIPDPSRAKYHGGENHYKGLDKALADIFFLYVLIFRKSLWIAEGIRTIAKEPFAPEKTIEKDLNYLFLGKDPIKVDSDACKPIQQNPNMSDYYRLIKQISITHKVF